MASALAKTPADEERKKAELARRVSAVQNVRSRRAKPGDTNYVKPQTVPESKKATWAKTKPQRGPATAKEAAAMARQGGKPQSQRTRTNQAQRNLEKDQGIAGELYRRSRPQPSLGQRLLTMFGF